MSISAARQNSLLTAYSFVRRSGFLDTGVGRRLFRSAYFLYKRYLEDNLEDLLRSHPALLRGGNVLDIGANIGYTASVLALSVDSGYKVYAFEPEPFNYALLQQTVSHVQLNDKITALQCAVGAENGSIDLWLNNRHHADHRVITDRFRSIHPGAKGPSVPLVSIDSFLGRNPEPVSFIKVDVQGYELAVCQGMQGTLSRNPGISVVLEYMPSALCELGFVPAKLISFFVDRNFQTYRVCPKGELLPGIPSAMDASGYADLLFSRRALP
jgi:FkbM family methyltransferase